MEQLLLKIEQLEKYYGNRRQMTKALDDVNFDIYPGEFVGIMGPSGSGKSTLLNCIATLDRPTSGHILLDGTDLTKLKAKKIEKIRNEQLGFIFQQFNLLDTLTAYENIALALTIQKCPATKIEPRVHRIAKKLGIESILKKFPYELSGGQQQRVAAARAMVTNPALVLADEPTGALDSKAARQLLERLEFLNHENHSTILMVTHDAFTASFASRILFIKDGKLFNQLEKGNDSRKQFFDRILDVIAVMGGGNDVF